MRFRRERSCSTAKGYSSRIVIQGLKPQFDQDDHINAWLKKYGSIEEIERFHNCTVVKFSSELQASEAVRCESGMRSSGSNVKLRLAHAGMMHQLVGKSSRRKRSRSPCLKSRNDCRSESMARLNNMSQISDKKDDHPLTWLSKAANQASSLKPLISHHSDLRNSTPQLESQGATIPSPQQPQSLQIQLDSSCRNSSKYDVAVLAVTHDLVHYAESVLALLHRRAIEEGGILLDKQRQRQTDQEIPKMYFRSPRVKIMVLMNVDHVAPCMQDLGEEGILFAILLNNANMTHNSCTLRILHSPTQQEHRNMPLADAVELLLKDFADYLEVNAATSASSVPDSKAKSPLPPSVPQKEPQQQSEEHGHHRGRHCCRRRRRNVSSSSMSSCSSASSSLSSSSSFRHSQNLKKQSHTPKRPGSHRHHHRPQQHGALVKEEAGLSTEASGVEEIPAPDDPNFLAPSRHVAVLLRMLADSRILSVGELDEISAFIAQRRSRLTNEFTAAEPLVYRGHPSSQLYVDTAEALKLNDVAMSSAGEMIFTPNFDPPTSQSFHREALSYSRYQKVYVDPHSSRRRPRH